MTFLYKLYSLNNEFIKNTNYLPDNFTGYYIHERGNVKYFKNGLYHREDGPAIIKPSGTKEWLVKDKLHRIGGPAIESYVGELFNAYYINGELISKEEHDLLYNLMKLKNIIR